MNRDRLLADAKAKALELAADYTPPEPVELRLPGPTARAALDLAVRGLPPPGQGDRRTTWWSPASWPSVLSAAATPTSPRSWTRTTCWRWSAPPS